MFGVGLPVALQCRVTLLPSVTTVSDDELSIAAGTITQHETKHKSDVFKIRLRFHLPLNQCVNASINQSINQSIDRSSIIDQSINQSIIQSINQCKERKCGI